MKSRKIKVMAFVKEEFEFSSFERGPEDKTF